MRLARLELQNFRSFESAKLQLDADGLIGVRGANGAGKSTLFEAVEFALYGKRRGTPPSRRSTASAGEPMRVEVQFYFDEHLMVVERTENSAKFIVDGTTVANTLSGAAREAVRQLGLTRDQFAATFYARQKEVQAFSSTKRLESIERLLGLTQLRIAAGYARTDAATQGTVVGAIADEQEDVAEARRVLDERQQRAKAVAPAAEQARHVRDQVRAERESAWESLGEAQQKVETGQQARANADLAMERERTTSANFKEAIRTLDVAQQAVAELKQLEPLAATVAERRARVGEMDLNAQAYQQFLVARQARAAAQKQHAELTDKLNALENPAVSSQELTNTLGDVRGLLDNATSELLETSQLIQDLSQRHGEAVRAAAVQRRARDLQELVKPLSEMMDERQALHDRQVTLQAEHVDVRRALKAERTHLEEVKRDGPDARCIRCRQHYGDRYNGILKEFSDAIGALETREETVTEELTKMEARLTDLNTRIDALRRLEGELASLSPSPPAEDPEVLASQLEREQTRAAALREQTEHHASRVGSLQTAMDQAKEQESARRRLLDEISRVTTEAEAFTKQLSGMQVDSYDEEAHQKARADLSQAEAAAERCAALRTYAGQLELLEKRRDTEAAALREAQSKAKQAQLDAETFTTAGDLLKAAKDRLQALEAKIEQAETAVQDAEQQALRESKDVEAAEQAVKRSLAAQRRLRTAQRESRYRDETARLLEAYAAHTQRRALPTLETETAQLLARLSSGKYDDIRLDDRAAMEILDDGMHRPLTRFSGGEQDLANLCLRLALSRTFARQRGTDAGLIVLDEVFGSQDLERRKTLIEQLRELDREFSQVFIVSHFNDVVRDCDIQIEVAREDGVSTARLIEKAAG
jgi:exonuclease SbcC